jgi:hypothetical protein
VLPSLLLDLLPLLVLRVQQCSNRVKPGLLHLSAGLLEERLRECIHIFSSAQPADGSAGSGQGSQQPLRAAVVARGRAQRPCCVVRCVKRVLYSRDVVLPPGPTVVPATKPSAQPYRSAQGQQQQVIKLGGVETCPPLACPTQSKLLSRPWSVLAVLL